MPHIQIECPRLSRAVKAKVVEGVTRAFCEATGAEPEILVIHISENPYDNVGVGGRLLTDTYPELRERPFYYDTGDARSTASDE